MHTATLLSFPNDQKPPVKTQNLPATHLWYKWVSQEQLWDKALLRDGSKHPEHRSDVKSGAIRARRVNNGNFTAFPNDVEKGDPGEQLGCAHTHARPAWKVSKYDLHRWVVQCLWLKKEIKDKRKKKKGRKQEEKKETKQPGLVEGGPAHGRGVELENI